MNQATLSTITLPGSTIAIGFITYAMCAFGIVGCMIFNMLLSSQLINVGMKVANLEKQQQALLLEKEQLEKSQTGNTSIRYVTELANNQGFVRIEKPLVVSVEAGSQVAQR